MSFHSTLSFLIYVSVFSLSSPMCLFIFSSLSSSISLFIFFSLSFWCFTSLNFFFPLLTVRVFLFLFQYNFLPNVVLNHFFPLCTDFALVFYFWFILIHKRVKSRRNGATKCWFTLKCWISNLWVSSQNDQHIKTNFKLVFI